MSNYPADSPAPNTKLACLWCMLSFIGGLVVVSSGCRQPYPYPPNAPYGPGAYQAGNPAATGPQSVFSQQQTSPQLVDLQRRVQQLDENNRQLTTQLAQAQQQAQAAQERSELLARQMQELTAQNRQLMATSQRYAEEARGLEASINSRGGARLTANNSLADSASDLQIPGVRVVRDGELIRIRIPSDQLFVTGTTELLPSASNPLDAIASTLNRRYPRQRVAVEGHTDGAQAGGGNDSTSFQLSGAQAQAVMDYLTRRGSVASQQLFVIAHGTNYPLADNQTPAGRAENRRIDVVIYPETF